MRLLLDTNIALPIINEHLEELSPLARSAISDSTATLFVSVATLWEMAIKVRLHKLGLRPALADLPEIISGLGVKVLPIVAAHVLAEIDPVPDTRDPFDRLLLAQCQVEGMRLITRDRALAEHPLSWRPA